MVAVVLLVLSARSLAAQPQVIVSPKGTTVTVGPNSSTTQTFTVVNTSSSYHYYSISATCGAPLSGCNYTPIALSIPNGQSGQVSVTTTSGTYGTSGQISVTAQCTDCYPSAQDNGAINLSVAPLPITMSVVSPKRFRDPTDCAISCGEHVEVYETPSYRSRDLDRTIQLVYRSGRARPLPVVEVDVSTVGVSPNRIGLKLFDANGAAVSFTNGATEVVRSFATGQTNRLAAQFDAANVLGSAPVKKLSVVMTAYDAGGSQIGQVTDSVRVMADWINGPASPYGAGWGISGLQGFQWATAQGPTDGLVIVDGSGDIGFWAFASQNGTTYNYRSPTRDYTTVTWDATAGVLTRRYTNGVVVRFSSGGNMISSTDYLGVSTTYAYADGGRMLTSTTDPVGQVIQLGYRGIEYPADGYKPNSLAFICSPGGARRCSSVGIEAATGNLLAVLDPDNVMNMTLTYNGSHAITQKVGRRGGTWSYNYDAVGELQSNILPTIPTNAGSTQLYQTTLGIPVQEVGGGSVTSPAAAIRSDTLRIRRWDAQTGQSEAYQVNGWGTSIRIEGSDNTTMTATRDTLGRATSVVDATGGIVNYVWNSAQPFLLDSSYDVRLQVGKRFYYDASSYYRVSRIMINGAESDSLTYSGGRLIKHRSGGPSQTPSTFGYARSWDYRPDTTIDARGHKIILSYESTGLQNASSVWAAQGTTSVIHDVFGRDSVNVDVLGNRTVTTYDVMNRPMTATDPMQHTLSKTYDAIFARTTTDASGQVYRDSLNALGMMVSSFNPAGQARTTTYDGAGRISTFLNLRGQSIGLSYHPTLGHLIGRSTPDNFNATYTSDALGQVRSAQNSESIDSVFADALGRDTLSVRRIPGLPSYRYVVRSTYDSASRRTTMVYDRWENGQPSQIAGNSNYVAIGYGAAGELHQLGNTIFSYNNETSPTQILYPTGAFWATRGYTDQHALASQRFGTTSGNTGADQFLGGIFSYDALNRITERYSADRRTLTRYYYGSVGWLDSTRALSASTNNCSAISDPNMISGDEPTGWTCTGPYSPAGGTDYRWDALGNPSGTGWQVAPNTANELVAANGQQIAYDADGNLTTKSAGGVVAQHLSWNSLGQLTGASGNGKDSVTFGYDAWGRRVRKTNVTKGTTQYYVWDGDNLAADLDGSGSATAMYTYYPGAVDRPFSATLGANGTYYYTTESPASVTGMLDGSGAMVLRYLYTPFGGTTEYSYFGAPSGWSNRLMFDAREYDRETGLYYERARYYDPSLQRFVSQDPGGISNGVNEYQFSGNDPVNGHDPAGTCTVLYTVTWNQSYSGGKLSDPYNIRVRIDGFEDCDGEEDNPGPFPPLFPDGPYPPVPAPPQQPNLPKVCTDAIAHANGATPEGVKRALEPEHWQVLKDVGNKRGVDPAELAAIAVRESNFRDVPENNGGPGLGWFQLDRKAHPEIVKDPDIAHNLRRAANFAVGLLKENRSIVRDKYPKFNAYQSEQAALAYYNGKKPKWWTDDPATIDSHTTQGNYGSNVLALMSCFK